MKIPPEWRDKKGRLHREGGPARIFPDGGEEYYRKGFRHRTDGPAISRGPGEDPIEVWMRWGKRHRVGGPAERYYPGGERYWQNGMLHRSDGPAVINMHKTAKGGYRRAWMLYGRPHRTNGPAIIDSHGVLFYYQEGVLHREEGPAIVRPEEVAKRLDLPEEEYYRYGFPVKGN